jgi:hypothetical protein
VVQVISHTPQPVCELSDFRGHTVGDKFYNYKLMKVYVSPETEFKAYKIVFSHLCSHIIKNLFTLDTTAPLTLG